MPKERKVVRRVGERFFQKDVETMGRKELDALQLQRLRRMVDYCYNHVPFYHKRLGEAGITGGDKIKALSDIQYIPFTTKDDIRDNYPFGMLAVPMKDIVRIHASSGTTGKPTVGAYTKGDIEQWSDFMARVVTAAGVTEEDVIQISFGYGLFTGALGLHFGLEKIGATVIPASSGNSEKQLMMLRDFGVTGLVATPSYALYLGELVRESGYPREAYGKLRHGILGSEGCTPEMRARIEETLGVRVTDNYGMTELQGPGVSGECLCRCGLHFNEDGFLPEIIDPDTLRPKARGEAGELVVTTLLREGMPVLRYRTKDITRLHYERERVPLPDRKRAGGDAERGAALSACGHPEKLPGQAGGQSRADRRQPSGKLWRAAGFAGKDTRQAQERAGAGDKGFPGVAEVPGAVPGQGKAGAGLAERRKLDTDRS